LIPATTSALYPLYRVLPRSESIKSKGVSAFKEVVREIIPLFQVCHEAE